MGTEDPKMQFAPLDTCVFLSSEKAAAIFTTSSKNREELH
jgi:hypothetical protein